MVLIPEKNIGIADYEIDGESGHLEAISGARHYPGTVDLREERQFQTIEVFGFDRAIDTEAKILEEIARQYSSEATGRIVLFTERPPCDSCSGVIHQFQAMFPNIEVDVIHNPATTLDVFSN